MRPIEDYLEEADAIAQEVMDIWANNLQEGNAQSLGEDFKVLFDKAFEYRQTMLIVESHRELQILAPTEAVNEQIARRAFVEVYKSYWDMQKQKSAASSE